MNLSIQKIIFMICLCIKTNFYKYCLRIHDVHEHILVTAAITEATADCSSELVMTTKWASGFTARQLSPASFQLFLVVTNL